jgi:lysozyme family protein
VAFFVLLGLAVVRSPTEPTKEVICVDAEERFAEAVEVVLEHEGGYVAHPNDPGGATNWGISLRFLQSLGYDVGDIDCDGDIDAEDIKQLPRERAIEMYREHWWKKYRYYRIENQEVATKIFDLSVNMGPSEAHKVLQRALHAVGMRYVEVDGVIGPQTIGAVNQAAPAALLAAVRAEAAAFYRARVASNPKLEQFQRGWLNRAYA